MKDVVLLFAIILFVLLVLIYPFKFKIALHLNVFDMVGFVAIRAFWFKLFSGKFIVDENGKFVLEKKNKKKTKKKKPISLLSEYFSVILKRLNVKKFEWYFTCGSNTNASFVSLLCGYVLSLDAIVSGILLDKYKHVKIYNDIDPIYNEDRFEASASIVVSFCLLDMLIGLFVAYRNYFKLIKEKKNVQ